MDLNNSSITIENNFCAPTLIRCHQKPKGSIGKITPKEIAKQIPSSRLSCGMSQRVRDIVAIFPQGEPTDPFRLNIVEHVNQTDKKIFSVTTIATERQKQIVHVGTEEPAGDGFEYVLAFVDKTTGKPIEFRPTSLINFQPRFNPNEELLTGRKRKLPVDYSKDFSVNKDDLRSERRRLTENFGNAKKMKMLEANIRRSITNETLMAGTSTTFSSSNVLTQNAGDGDQNEGTSQEKKKPLAPLSILEKGASSVLPAPNYNAKVPAEVYKMEQFLPKEYEHDSQIREQLEKEALNYFKQRDTLQKLVHSGVPPFVSKRIGQPWKYTNPGRRSLLALKIVALSKFIRVLLLKKGEKIFCNITSNELRAFELPQRMISYLHDQYIGAAKSSGFEGFKMQVSDSDKHRALAELLCLLLLFDEPDFQLPISPLVQEFGVTEAVLKKLLAGMGCLIKVATEAQAIAMNTVRIAHLTGPPKKDSRLIIKGKKRSMASQAQRK